MFPPLLYIIIVFLIVPCFLLYSLWKVSATSVWMWLYKITPLLLITMFFFFTANWSWVSYYLRYLFVGLVLVAVALSYRKIDAQKRKAKRVRIEKSSLSRSQSWMQRINQVFGYVLPLVLLFFIAKGFFYTDTAVELSFPLQGGRYYVGHGGNSRVINYHNGIEAQQYALDILAVNQFGVRAQWIYPTELEKYVIYGAPVTSPCTGTVVDAVDGLVDLTPPRRDTQNLAGNHLIIDCANVRVVLAHLKQGSLQVQSGDSVRDGQPLAQVGNSGNTSEPHLHIHAVAADSGGMLFGTGVPILFDGRFLTRNSVVNR